MKNHPLAKSLCIGIATIFGLASCAPLNGTSGQTANSDDPCNPLALAIVGAGVGALAHKKDRAKGAVVGGAASALACLAINATTRQVKSAQTVEREYVQARGSLPPAPLLVNYSTSIQPGQVMRAGNQVQLQSNIEVVEGKNVPIREVREQIVLFDPEGKEFKRGEKLVSDSNNGSGQFQNTFSFTLPSQAPQGIYTAKTVVIVNNQPLRQNDSKVQIVLGAETRKLLLATAPREAGNRQQ